MIASPERGDSPRGGEMPEGQRGPLSTRWAAKPLGGVGFVTKSRLKTKKNAVLEPLSQCYALPALTERSPLSLRDISPFYGESPLSGEPYLPHIMILRTSNQRVLGNHRRFPHSVHSKIILKKTLQDIVKYSIIKIRFFLGMRRVFVQLCRQPAHAPSGK